MKYRISLLDQISMIFRGSPLGKIKWELKKAEIHRLNVDGSQLELHFLAGGNIKDVINSLIYAQENGIVLDWQRAAASQLALMANNEPSLLKKLKEMKEKGLSDIDAFLWKKA